MNGMHTTPHTNKPNCNIDQLALPGALTPFSQKTSADGVPFPSCPPPVNGWSSHTFITAYGTYLHPDQNTSTSEEVTHSLGSPSLSLLQNPAINAPICHIPHFSINDIDLYLAVSIKGLEQLFTMMKCM